MMASRFHNITAEEMDKYLREKGFSPLTIEGTVELVYGKVVRIREHRLSLRVYTAINPSGESREKGSDAIRIQLYYMYDGEAWGVGKPHKCLRVKTWKSNMTKAINVCEDPEGLPDCPACKHPMVERENSRTGGKFWGCVTYHKTQCDGKPPAPEQREQRPAPQEALLAALRTIQNRWKITENPDKQGGAPWDWDDLHERIAGHLRVCVENIESEK
jgi:hypothetical protein